MLPTRQAEAMQAARELFESRKWTLSDVNGEGVNATDPTGAVTAHLEDDAQGYMLEIDLNDDC